MIVLFSTLLSYATYYYGVIIDIDMLDNIFQTNSRESLTYFNSSLVLWFVLLGLLPSFFIFQITLTRPSFIRETLERVLSFFLSLFLIIGIGVFYYQDYVTTLRNHHALQKMIIPLHALFSISRYVYEKELTKPLLYQPLGLDAKQIKSTKTPKPQILVIVVGETARSQNYQSNHYPRPTNAYTKSLNMVAYQHASSCGTATAISLPCMFSNMTRANFSNNVAKNQDNLVDILQHAGLYTVWLDNNTGCKGVCKHIKTIETNPNNSKGCDGKGHCYDEVLLNQFKKELQHLPNTDSVIVIHLLGSHGPDYYERYPDNQRYFSPNCQRNDIQHCTHESLINTYDNTIRYADFVVSELIKQLQAQKSSIESSLIYLSDHGESFGEHGLYLHGTPYALAPKEQTSIPFMLWFSKGFLNNHAIKHQCLETAAETQQISHDNLFHSVLGLLEIKTQEYQKPLDLFASCKNGEK